MIIPLTKSLSGRWKNPEGTLELCWGRLVQFGAPKFSPRCNLTVRLKNPKKAGFVKVNIYKTSDGWNWKDSLNIWKESANCFFDITDKYINRLFPKRSRLTVWVSIEKA
jgi:hypothetical protein